MPSYSRSGESMTAPRLKDSAPCFLVHDVRATAEHYRDVFGFCFDELFGEPPTFAMLFRDGATVVLQEAPEDRRPVVKPNAAALPGACDAFFGVNDVKALAEELAGRGADIVQPPVYRPIYDGWEMVVRDLDGRLVLFSQAD